MIRGDTGLRIRCHPWHNFRFKFLGAGRDAIPNYGSVILEVEIMRFGRKPRDKGGRPKKIAQE